MYPDRAYTNRVQQQRFSVDRLARWATEQTRETIRIEQIGDVEFLKIEMQEAEQKWEFARQVVESGKPVPMCSVEDAEWLMVLACHRYWTAYNALHPVRRHERLLIAIGLVLAVIGTIAAVAALF